MSRSWKEDENSVDEDFPQTFPPARLSVDSASAISESLDAGDWPEKNPRSAD